MKINCIADIYLWLHSATLRLVQFPELFKSNPDFGDRGSGIGGCTFAPDPRPEKLEFFFTLKKVVCVASLTTDLSYFSFFSGMNLHIKFLEKLFRKTQLQPVSADSDQQYEIISSL